MCRRINQRFLKEKIPAVAPKRLPLEGKLSAKQTEEVSPYASFLCRNRRTVPSVDTSSDPLRGPPSPPRGRLLDDAPATIAYCLKETPHNARGPLAGEFQPLAACKNLDYPPGNLRFLQFAIDCNSLRY